ncbi:MAG: hypothetical protein RIT43_50 [Bacteroidota bacterium]|jgi:hypothetical protein
MRIGTVIFFLCFVSSIKAQLIKGTLMDDQRKMISTFDFKVEDPNAGTVFFELAVNPKGKVTSARVVEAGTTIVSTPTRINVRKALMTLLFEEGTWYPEFHHVVVQVTTVKPEAIKN